MNCIDGECSYAPALPSTSSDECDDHMGNDITTSNIILITTLVMLYGYTSYLIYKYQVRLRMPAISTPMALVVSLIYIPISLIDLFITPTTAYIIVSYCLACSMRSETTNLSSEDDEITPVQRDVSSLRPTIDTSDIRAELPESIVTAQLSTERDPRVELTPPPLNNIYFSDSTSEHHIIDILDDPNE